MIKCWVTLHFFSLYRNVSMWTSICGSSSERSYRLRLRRSIRSCRSKCRFSSLETRQILRVWVYSYGSEQISVRTSHVNPLGLYPFDSEVVVSITFYLHFHPRFSSFFNLNPNHWTSVFLISLRSLVFSKERLLQ